MLPDEAIEKVRDAGFAAFEADWKLGRTIFCGKEHPKQVPAKDKGQEFTLEEACGLAIGILASPFVPLREDEMEMGDETFMHRPTEVRRTLFRPDPSHQKVLTTKEEALRIKSRRAIGRPV